MTLILDPSAQHLLFLYFVGEFESFVQDCSMNDRRALANSSTFRSLLFIVFDILRREGADLTMSTRFLSHRRDTQLQPEYVKFDGIDHIINHTAELGWISQATYKYPYPTLTPVGKSVIVSNENNVLIPWAPWSKAFTEKNSIYGEDKAPFIPVLSNVVRVVVMDVLQQGERKGMGGIRKWLRDIALSVLQKERRFVPSYEIDPDHTDFLSMNIKSDQKSSRIGAPTFLENLEIGNRNYGNIQLSWG